MNDFLFTILREFVKYTKITVSLRFSLLPKYHPCLGQKMEKNLEFNFWVYRHDTWMLLTQSFSNDRLLLFTINSSTCSLKPLSGLPITNFPLHSVKDSFLFHGRRSLIAEVTILIEDQDPITLIPINPFDPPVFFHRNDAEAQAIVRIVSQLKKGETPDDNSNPYLRQLHKKDVPNYVTAKGMNWNENISPWAIPSPIRR